MVGLGETVKRNLYASYAYTVDTANQLARRSGARISAALTTSASNDPVHNVALDAAETLKSKIKTEDGKIAFEYDGFQQPQENALELFTKLETNLTLGDGSLNTQSILLNDRELLATIIDLSGDKELTTQFRDRAKDLINTVIVTSAKRGGYLTKGCPSYITDILSNKSDDPDSKTKRYTATIQLILELARKNKTHLEVNDVVRNLLNDIPDRFAGDIGELVEPMIRKTIEEVLSSTPDIFNDRDLEINPTLLRRYASALGDLFLSGVPKPLRQDNLVLAVKDIVTAYENRDRDYGSSKSIGIESARQNFMNLWFEERDSLNIQEANLSRLRKKAEEIRIKIKTGSQIQLDKSLCSAPELASVDTSNATVNLIAKNHHLDAIKNQIRESEANLQDLRTDFDKKLTAIKFAFDNIASPFTEDQSGIRDMFFERLIGRTSDGEKVSEDDLVKAFIKSTAEENFNYKEMADPSYGEDFQGLKKQTLANLRAVQANIPEKLREIDSFNEAIEEDSRILTESYFEPINQIVKVDSLFDESHVTKLNLALNNFCKENHMISSVMDKIHTCKSKATDIVEHLIIKNAEGKFVIDQSKITSETTLTIVEQEALKKTFDEILVQYNAFYADEKNENQKFDFNPFATQANSVVNSIKSKVRNDYLINEDTRNTTTLANLFSEYDKHRAIANNSVAAILEYERDALNSSQAVLNEKLEILATDLGIDGNLLTTLVTPNLKEKIAKATELRKDIQKNLKDKETFTILNNPDHPDFSKAWDTQLNSVSMEQVFTMAIGQDLNKMGMSAKNAKVLIEAINDSDILEIYENNETSYGRMVKDFFSKLMQFLLQLTAGGKQNA